MHVNEYANHWCLPQKLYLMCKLVADIIGYYRTTDCMRTFASTE